MARRQTSTSTSMTPSSASAGASPAKAACWTRSRADRKSTRLNSSHTEIYTLSLHDALPICVDGTQPDLDQHVHDPVLGQRRSLAREGGVLDAFAGRSEEHTSELQSHRDLHSFPTRRSSDLRRWHAARPRPARP